MRLLYSAQAVLHITSHVKEQTAQNTGKQRISL